MPLSLRKAQIEGVGPRPSVAICKAQAPSLNSKKRRKKQMSYFMFK